ncbi:hypothetical protein BN871_GZ_00050 [Paenibacillus sp. P22]|nr:hypothetical protein BN871_GZ_00050 [Paenibacillus sp. P22]
MRPRPAPRSWCLRRMRIPLCAVAPSDVGSAERDDAAALRDRADAECLLAQLIRRGNGRLRLIGRHDNDEADAHIERREHIAMRDGAFLLHERENRLDRPAAVLYLHVHAFRQHARDVLDEAAAGNMGHALHLDALDQLQRGLDVDLRRLDQDVAQLLAAELLELVLQAVARLLQQQPAHERVSVAVDAARGQADDSVSRRDRRAVDDLLAVDDADGEAADIVFLRGVHARHLGRLAPDQGAACLHAAFGDAGDDRLDLGRLHLARRQVIEEEQRLGALHDDVVDAHGDGVDADRVMLVHGKSEHQLRADAVGAGDEHRLLVLVLVEAEHASEAAQAAQHLGAERSFHMLLHPFDRFVARRDVDSGLLVCLCH